MGYGFYLLFLPCDGRKSPFVRSVNRTAERRWKAVPHAPPRTRPHIHNQSERLPRFGLIKYSSGEIVDYAAAATIAASPARARSLPQWKDSTKRVDKTAVTIDGYVTRNRAHEHPETLKESEFCGVSFRDSDSDPESFQSFRECCVEIGQWSRIFTRSNGR